MRETGRPEVSVRFIPGTPEEAARNRGNVESAFRSVLLRRGGNRKLEISWSEEPVHGKSENLLCSEKTPEHPPNDNEQKKTAEGISDSPCGGFAF
ncbi:MAG TPA: hypothetical protein VHP54_02020 [Caproiciproducens sp.]|nr:hypothetical protein [Caproiciproducens sp.]